MFRAPTTLPGFYRCVIVKSDFLLILLMPYILLRTAVPACLYLGHVVYVGKQLSPAHFKSVTCRCHVSLCVVTVVRDDGGGWGVAGDYRVTGQLQHNKPSVASLSNWHT